MVDKILERRNKREKITGLYIGKNKGQPSIVKFGASDCLQDRIYSGSYKTGFYYPWEFTLFIPEDQSKTSKCYENQLLSYIKYELKLQPGYGKETFKYDENIITYDDIVASIFNKLKEDFSPYIKMLDTDCEFDKYKVKKNNYKIPSFLYKEEKIQQHEQMGNYEIPSNKDEKIQHEQMGNYEMVIENYKLKLKERDDKIKYMELEYSLKIIEKERSDKMKYMEREYSLRSEIKRLDRENVFLKIKVESTRSDIYEKLYIDRIEKINSSL